MNEELKAKVDKRLDRFRERANKINGLVDLLTKLEALKPLTQGFIIEVEQRGNTAGSLPRAQLEKVFDIGRKVMIKETERELEQLLAVEPTEVVEQCRVLDMKGQPASPETARQLAAIAEGEAEIGR